LDDVALHTHSLKGFLSVQVPPVTYVAEKCLGFGVSLSSNVAQRLSEAIVADFRARFDAQECIRFANILDPVTGVCSLYNKLDKATLTDGSTDACRWIDGRGELSAETGQNQLRLYSVHINTDDPVFKVVGTDRLIRAMRVWNQVTIDWGFRTAIARKRQVAPAFVGLGSTFTYQWALLQLPQKRLLGLIAFWILSSLAPQ
jgi:hypothetical protein